MGKIGRNQPCPCGNGKKYKHCHGSSSDAARETAAARAIEATRVANVIRRRQQGDGRPIVGTKLADHQMVAVGNKVYFSKNWKTFPDFLGSFIIDKLSRDWIMAEEEKSPPEQHPIIPIRTACLAYHQATIKNPGEVVSAPLTGAVAAYLGIAYALYLLEHNVELQDRLLHRLKDAGQFQGAYYELFVASALIRAGFALTLEDETDPNTKHCEFFAVSKETGSRYWVEAKMRAVAGLLGRKDADGGKDEKPLARVIKHLNKALSKPTTDERLIFIDVNVPSNLSDQSLPDWLEPVMKRLEKFESKDNHSNATAYVWITNLDYHRQLDGQPSFAASPFGLGMSDFNRPGQKTVIDAYKERKKHSDAHRIGAALQTSAHFPATFDGGLPSEAFENSSERIKVGETYFFGDADNGGRLDTVTSVTVAEPEKEIWVGLRSGQIWRGPISDVALAEYREYGDAYFGQVPYTTIKQPKDNFEMFTWLMDANESMSRETMLNWFGPHRDRTELEALDDSELRMRYCDANLAVILNLPKSGKPG